ncbi:uncharacterized protein LOC141849713 [Brevipalpus obovatus]|uniref:uncharacterized protein LOC141849713 n=1 Tax=Brevipalpus obovatus TaxID=246614 RepID=UPI003D9F7AAF
MKFLLSITVVFIAIGYFYYTKYRVSEKSSNATKLRLELMGEEFKKMMAELSSEERAKVDRVIERNKIEWARDNLISQTEYILRQIPRLKSMMDSEPIRALQKTAESVLPRLKVIETDDPDAEEKMKKIYGELEKVRDDMLAEEESKMKKSSQKSPFL